jgi:hypothetical protein
MHKIQRTKNTMTMMNNRQHHSIGRHVVKSCPLLRRGSRRGYYADVDDKPPPDSTRDDDDEEEEEEDDEQVDVAIDSKGISRTRISFYSHIQPKKRRCRDNIGNNEITPWQRQSGGERTSSSSTSRTTKTHHHYWTTHPDIDLSLVSLLSSRELDRRMTRARGGRGGRGGGGGDSRSSSSSLSDQSPSSTSVSPDTVNTSEKIEKDDGSGRKLQNAISSSSENIIFTKARPLAVVDYGSIELDMSGSLLDSIYKIGPPSTTTTGKSGEGTKDDWSTMIGERGGGGRKRRHNQLFPSSAHKKYESTRSKRRHDRATTTATTCSSSAVTAAFDVTAIEHQISRIEQTRKVPTPARDEVVQVDARCDTSSCAHSPLSKDRRGATTINSSEQANLLDDTSSSCAVQVQNISSTTLLGSSRRSHFTTTTTTPPMTHEGGCTTTETRTVVKKDSGLVSSNAKARRKMKVYGILPTISKVPTTLEAAISFSPFAR